MFISQNIKAEVVESKARCGGGALPQHEFDSYSVKILFDQPEKKLADKLFKALLRYEKPILGIMREGEILLDVFTVQEGELSLIADIVLSCLNAVRA
jgi:seryl-tRNA(Sec) selenium transferase